MTIHQILKTTGYDVSEIAFPDNVTPSLPFILWEDITSSDFWADNKPYVKIRPKEVRLCNGGNQPDHAAKANLEAVFVANAVPYKLTSSGYIKAEKIFETVYEIQVRE